VKLLLVNSKLEDRLNRLSP